MLNRNVVQHGDKVWTPARRIPGKRHYGIWDAKNRVFIHNTIPGGVQEATREDFVNGAFYIEQRAAPGFEDYIVERARALLGHHYDLFAFNCEHFVNFVADGESKSPQLQKTVMAAFFGYLIAKAINAPDYDRTVERYRDRKGRFARG